MKLEDLRVGNTVLEYNKWHENRWMVSEIRPESFNNPIREFKSILLDEELILANLDIFSWSPKSKYKVRVTLSNCDMSECTFKKKSIFYYLYCDFRKDEYYIKFNGQKVYVTTLDRLQNIHYDLTGSKLVLRGKL